ncbi:PAS domain-containing protein [Candidatus Binatia bacterium]|jgi:PAS domain S-box-containing protein|nr:PAS domain-containing protein [Candidatus Binatia bacterium]
MSRHPTDASVSDSSLRRSPIGLAAVLEALPCGAALLERSGAVVACNELWRRFHHENGMGDGFAPGGNLLDACAATEGDDGGLGASLRGVLDDDRPAFEREDELVRAGRTLRYRTIARRVHDEQFDGAVVLRIDAGASSALGTSPSRAQHALEQLVSERTADLSRANVLLQYEIDERRRASEERNRLLDEVRVERRMLAAVLAQMPLGVMIAEPPSGRVVLHNEELERLVGKPVAAVGSVLATQGGRALRPDGRAYAPDEYPLLRALRGESVDAEEIEYQRGDGSRIILRASAVPVRDADGQILAAVVTYDDVTDWRTTERRLRASETRYRLASRAVRDAIWDLDVATEQIHWSDGITLCFGYPPGTVEPSIAWWLERIDPTERTRVADGLAEALAGTASHWQDEYRFRCLDGRWADVVDRGFIVRDASGRALRAVGAMEDVSERRRAEAERAALLERERRARADAEAANRAKDEFLAVVSHELRTPLSPILGFLEILLEDPAATPEQRMALATIERNARSLSFLIDDLLDVSRITSGKLSLEYVPVELGELVRAVVESARPAADGKGVRLALESETDALLVAGDAGRLTQVIANLLSNAIKFTPLRGEVAVALVRDRGRAVIRVRDTGKGIAPDLLPHVFERFRQGDTSDTRVHGGLGLGLAIVRHIVDRHGGVVTAASPGENLGATFTVELPLRDPPRS